ncbi:MAG: DUF6307 family protein [Mycobacteriales bacterium]|jgi:uncharacterized protein YoaH (UPF0181 family)
MSQSYEQRRAAVEQVLVAEGIRPGKGKTLTELAAKVLRAIDYAKEDIR